MQQMRNFFNAFKGHAMATPHHANAQAEKDKDQLALAVPEKIPPIICGNDENLNMLNKAPEPKQPLVFKLTAAQAPQQVSSHNTYKKIILTPAIRQYLLKEIRYLPNRRWMTSNENSFMKPSHRTAAIEYFSDLHQNFGLKFTTFLLAVNMFDRYLSVATIEDSAELWRFIQATIYLAMKLQEVYPPTIEELLDVSVPSVVTTVFNQEEKLVKALNLDFKHISPYGYLSALHTTSNLSEEESHLCNYLLELWLLDNAMMGVESFSLVALAIDYLLFLNRNGGNGQSWVNIIGAHQKEAVQITALDLYNNGRFAKNNFKPLYRKYSRFEYGCVSRNIFFSPSSK